ncbi:bacteriocin fulvocin C-related protein [Nocardiopsis oceani]
MIHPFVRGLGALATLRVLEALGELSRQRRRAPWERARIPTPDTPRRPRLPGLIAGSMVVVSLALAGRTPALARSDHALAREWVEANRARLPRDYDEFAAHPLVRRRLVFSELSPDARRDLWLEHLRRYERAHPRLTPAQREVVDLARGMLSDRLVFRDGLDPARERELRGLAVSAFGTEEAHALLATLGPDEPDPHATNPAKRGRCGAWEPCLSKGCREVPFTCGTAWVYTRDGLRERAEP